MIKSLRRFSNYFRTTGSDAVLVEDTLTQSMIEEIDGKTIVSKFGENEAVGTSFVPISLGGFLETPTSNQSLEILSSSAADAAAGIGARTVRIEGIVLVDGRCVPQTEDVTMNGLTPVNLTKSWFRVCRAYVLTTGQYPGLSAFSNQGTITLRVQGGGNTYLQIGLLDAGRGMGQSQTTCFTVPCGKRGVLRSKKVTAETGKTVTVALFQRTNSNITTEPFGTVRLVEVDSGIDSPTTYDPDAPILLLEPNTDIFFLAKVSVGTAIVAVDFQIELFDID